MAESGRAGATIVLGVGGGIAAYKVAELSSRLHQRGHQVHVVLTAAAARFVAPLTFTALTGHEALTSLWDQALGEGPPGMAHIALAERADLIVVAPATADLLARLAAGLGDDLLGATVLASRAPLLLVPAMNPAMWHHPATQRSLATLRADGALVVDPASGRMACEHVGTGRLPEPAALLEHIEQLLLARSSRDTTATATATEADGSGGANRALAPLPLAPLPLAPLQGVGVLVTAGPTREAIDPVRFLSNRSSGRMGYAIAEEAARRGARVTLVSGPVALPVPPGVHRVEVISALEMRDATLDLWRSEPGFEALIAAAAPADFRAAAPGKHKIKRAGRPEIELRLVANPDIVRECAHHKRDGQIVIGFAAETQNLEANARAKLVEKGLDAIFANDVSDSNSGFDAPDNGGLFLDAMQSLHWPTRPKAEIAALLCERLEALLASRPKSD